MLTPRQREVLVALSFGLTYEETAEALGIGLETVKYHARLVRQRMGVATSTQAISQGFRLGILEREFEC